MKILFDTSVLVAATVEAHPKHNRALPWLQRGKSGEIISLAASHTLAELYAILTTLPLKPRISPKVAWRLLHENVLTAAKIISLTFSDYRDILRQMSESGLAGGVVYDALIVRVARKSNADKVLTFNSSDFLRIWPEGEGVIHTP
jgi:predicted nucleic acid-binding protein